MLHTKFQGHRSIASGEVIFKVFTIYGHGGHAGHFTQLILYKYPFPFSLKFLYGSKLPNCFCEKQVLTLKSE